MVPGTKSVLFVGNNWDGTADIVDPQTFAKLGRINVIPDLQERLAEKALDPRKLGYFLAVRALIGEGNDQFADDMFTLPRRALRLHLAPEPGRRRGDRDRDRQDRLALPDGGLPRRPHGDLARRHPAARVRLDRPQGARARHRRPARRSASSSRATRRTRATTPRTARGSSTPASAWSTRRPTSRWRTRPRATAGSRSSTRGPTRCSSAWTSARSRRGNGYTDYSSAVRPMAIAPDERIAYLQLSFLHGFVEFDLATDKPLRVANLPHQRGGAGARRARSTCSTPPTTGWRSTTRARSCARRARCRTTRRSSSATRSPTRSSPPAASRTGRPTARTGKLLLRLVQRRRPGGGDRLRERARGRATSRSATTRSGCGWGSCAQLGPRRAGAVAAAPAQRARAQAGEAADRPRAHPRGRLDMRLGIDLARDRTAARRLPLARPPHPLRDPRSPSAAAAPRSRGRSAARLPRAQRRKATGIVTLRYAGDARVRPDRAALARRADGRALLRRDDERGSTRPGRARRRAAPSAAAPAASCGSGSTPPTSQRPAATAPRSAAARWSLRRLLPSKAARGGQLSIQYTGHERPPHPRRVADQGRRARSNLGGMATSATDDLRSRLSALTLRDEHRLKRRFDRARRSGDAQALRKLETEIEKAEARVARRRARSPRSPIRPSCRSARGARTCWRRSATTRSWSWRGRPARARRPSCRSCASSWAAGCAARSPTPSRGGSPRARSPSGSPTSWASPLGDAVGYAVRFNDRSRRTRWCG